MDLEEMTSAELSALIDEAGRVLARRQSVEALDDQIGELLRDARAGGVVETPAAGAAWVQPAGAHDAYLAGDVVEHGGASWESTVAYNVWRPGESGWRQLPGEDGAPAEYVQPTGAHDAYQTGDQVTFEGVVWESLIDSNTWSPADYPAAWRKVE